MECLEMIKVRHGEVTHSVPCGKCAFCLMNKRSQWMFRVYHEMKRQVNPGWFITLTYDEKHVKRVSRGVLSLRFRDVQLFLKRVRKAKYYCKYVCVGEYGGQTKRPHYHMLIWTNCPVMKLESYWSKGSVHIGRISMKSAMYTLKYIIQPKQRDVDGIEKTRAQFSKGIGLGYLSSAVYDYHTLDYDSPVFVSMVDGQKVALPRYYRCKIFTKYQLGKEGSRLKWESIRKKRKLMRQLKAQGVVDWKKYVKDLRVETARRIILETKFNQIL